MQSRHNIKITNIKHKVFALQHVWAYIYATEPVNKW